MMQSLDYVGRAEALSRRLMERVLTGVLEVRTQVPLECLIDSSEYVSLNPVLQKHKFDIVVIRTDDVLVVEVNYRHGDNAYRKWSKFVPLLRNSTRFYPKRVIPVAIDDYDTRHLFTVTRDHGHVLTWDDYRDVIDQLEKARVVP